jgi:NitT/TauT family transport system ATP-binding protein
MDLQLRGVSHRYDVVEVLSDINLDITHGEIVCIVGPSGCGKSTLLRCLGGLEQPTHGTVLQRGAPPPRSLNPLTYVFQDFALLPWRTVGGNIACVLEDHKLGRSEINRRIDDVLRRTKLSDFKDAYPRQLSGGMKQRVAIARAMSVDPAVLLMDEPLSALDSQTRELMIDDLIDLMSRETLTTVYITHNLAEAVALGSRIVVMSRRPGRIRDIISITVPLKERRARPELMAAEQARLWDLMRAEARAADMELAHV